MASPALSRDYISHTIYLHDPMNTCCVENECRDEYDRVALGITERLASGQDLKAATHDEFIDWFEAAPNESSLNAICQALESGTSSQNKT